MSYDVVVVGGGFGGASCAALLAKEGLKVLLLEKNENGGGKGQSEWVGGFNVSLFTHLCSGDKEIVWTLNEVGMGDRVKLVTVEPDVLLKDRSSGKYKSVKFSSASKFFTSSEMLIELAKVLDIPGSKFSSVAELFGTILSMEPSKIDLYDDVTLEELLSNYDIPQSLHSVLGAIVLLFFVDPIDLASAGEFIRTVQDLSKGNLCYPEGGISSIPDAYVEAVRRNGGEVRLNTEVEGILIKDGGVVGVETKDGVDAAKVVVSNAGIQPTVLKLVGREHFDKAYINYVRGLMPSLGGIGIRYYLDKQVLDNSSYVAVADYGYSAEHFKAMKEGKFPEELLLYVTVPAAIDSRLAPEGEQALVAMTIALADIRGNYQQWLDKMDSTVGHIWPEIPKHTKSKDYFTSSKIAAKSRWSDVSEGYGGEVVGIAQIAGQCGAKRPNAKSPINGLFYVGFDAGGWGIGLEHAVRSGRYVAHLVRRTFEKQYLSKFW